MHGKVPATIITVAVERIYYQCPKALARSRLWAADAPPANHLPTAFTATLGEVVAPGLAGRFG